MTQQTALKDDSLPGQGPIPQAQHTKW